MIERKTMEKRNCPNCGHVLDKLSGYDEQGKYVYVNECPKCGDVTEKFTFKWLRDRWDIRKKEMVPESVYTYEYPKGIRKIHQRCKNCLTVFSHPLKYCCYCGGEIDRSKIEVTIEEWLNKSPNEKQFEKRFREVSVSTIKLDLIYPEMSYEERIHKLMEILDAKRKW